MRAPQVEGPGSDAAMVERLRAGDEAAFRELVELHHSAMVRSARAFVGSEAVAEEVAQEAWVGIITGIGRFEGRSSLATWMFRIVANLARTRGERERRCVPTGLSGELPSRARRSDLPYDLVLARTTFDRVLTAAAGLTDRQRRVFDLRIFDGRTSAEVCALLRISEANQRVLLHRARSRVRAALADEPADAEGAHGRRLRPAAGAQRQQSELPPARAGGPSVEGSRRSAIASRASSMPRGSTR